MKIDLQELKRLAGPGRVGEAIHVETRSLKALVDVVEKALELREHSTEMFDPECPACDAFLAALTPFTESTNEEA